MECVICSKPIDNGQMVWLNDHPAHFPECPTEAGNVISLEPKPWDDTGKHQEIHEHTQD